jgi:hypothetical protein
MLVLDMLDRPHVQSSRLLFWAWGALFLALGSGGTWRIVMTEAGGWALTSSPLVRCCAVDGRKAP